ncbi:hypothetical protein COMA2_220006 [Candidatus Nitrospira nitrificans]|uniref:Uncharacterized protein n=1 Tax=Candidatus Nitrospira nitrificans TaxID=1742973 RepID=A0A0S4LHW1_9BACT|nr:hypothetical protein COMA2_220006 [Candidatus Nitrospira nitrificans]
MHDQKGTGTAGSMKLLERNAFFNQHHWNMVTDGVEDRPIGANQTTVELAGHWTFSHILQFASGHRGIEFLDERLFRQTHRLFRLRATKDCQELFINTHDHRSPDV